MTNVFHHSRTIIIITPKSDREQEGGFVRKAAEFAANEFFLTHSRAIGIRSGHSARVAGHLVAAQKHPAHNAREATRKLLYESVGESARSKARDWLFISLK